MPARPSRSLGAVGTLAVTGLVYLWALACIAWGAPSTPTLSPADVQPEDEVLITITGRSFRPIAVSFQGLLPLSTEKGRDFATFLAGDADPGVI